MKDYFDCGYLIECFCITPSINFNWMHKTNTTPMSWELQFAWFFGIFQLVMLKLT